MIGQLQRRVFYQVIHFIADRRIRPDIQYLAGRAIKGMHQVVGVDGDDAAAHRRKDVVHQCFDPRNLSQDIFGAAIHMRVGDGDGRGVGESQHQVQFALGEYARYQAVVHINDAGGLVFVFQRHAKHRPQHEVDNAFVAGQPLVLEGVICQQGLAGLDDLVNNRHANLRGAAAVHTPPQQTAFAADAKFQLAIVLVAQNDITALRLRQDDDQLHRFLQDGINIKRIGDAS